MNAPGYLVPPFGGSNSAANFPNTVQFQQMPSLGWRARSRLGFKRRSTWLSSSRPDSGTGSSKGRRAAEDPKRARRSDAIRSTHATVPSAPPRDVSVGGRGGIVEVLHSFADDLALANDGILLHAIRQERVVAAAKRRRQRKRGGPSPVRPESFPLILKTPRLSPCLGVSVLQFFVLSSRSSVPRRLAVAAHGHPPPLPRHRRRAPRAAWAARWWDTTDRRRGRGGDRPTRARRLR